MASPRFVVGQRWISQGETELGLGLVAEIEGRHVRLFFPAAEAYRTYAADDAPLSRYRVDPGQLLTDNEDRSERVLEVKEQAGILHYRILREGEACWLDELRPAFGEAQFFWEAGLQSLAESREITGVPQN